MHVHARFILSSNSIYTHTIKINLKKCIHKMCFNLKKKDKSSKKAIYNHKIKYYPLHTIGRTAHFKLQSHMVSINLP